MQHTYVELLFVSTLFKWFETVYCAVFSFWAIATVLTSRSDPTIFIVLPIFSTVDLRCIFDKKITEMESTKPKLSLINCYSIKIINVIHFFSCLACFFAFISPSLWRYHLWRVLKKYWIKHSQNCLRSYFSTISYLSNVLALIPNALIQRVIHITKDI